MNGVNYWVIKSVGGRYTPKGPYKTQKKAEGVVEKSKSPACVFPSYSMEKEQVLVEFKKELAKQGG